MSSKNLRDRQEITWTFECPIAPHLGSLLNRKIRNVEPLRLWFRSIGRDPIWGTLGPQIVQLISCRSLRACVCPKKHSWASSVDTCLPGRGVADRRYHLKRCAKPIFVRVLKGLASVLRTAFAIRFVFGGSRGNKAGGKQVVQEEVQKPTRCAASRFLINILS